MSDRDFNIGLRSGILDPKHYKAMGLALWAFVWAIDRQTGAHGLVYGGAAITYEQAAQEIGLPNARTARTQIDRLVEQGYLAREPVFKGRACAGFALKLTAPKKIHRGSADTDPSPPEKSDLPPGKVRPPPRKSQTSPPEKSEVVHPAVRDNVQRLKGDSVDQEHPPTPQRGDSRDSGQDHPADPTGQPPRMAPEDFLALATEHGFKWAQSRPLDFTSGANLHRLAILLRCPRQDVERALRTLRSTKASYQPKGVEKILDWLQAVADASDDADDPDNEDGFTAALERSLRGGR